MRSIAPARLNRPGPTAPSARAPRKVSPAAIRSPWAAGGEVALTPFTGAALTAAAAATAFGVAGSLILPALPKSRVSWQPLQSWPVW